MNVKEGEKGIQERTYDFQESTGGRISGEGSGQGQVGEDQRFQGFKD